MSLPAGSVLFTKRFPEISISHDIFVLGFPVCINSFPSLPLEFIVAYRTDPRRIFAKFTLTLTTEAFSFGVHVFCIPLNSRPCNKP
jgi:hypothetical protein